MTNILSRPIRICVYLVSSIFLGTLGYIESASAVVFPPCTTPSPLTGGESVTISSNCSDLVLNGAGNVQVLSPAIVYGNAGIAIDNSGITNSISNAGSITGPSVGVDDGVGIKNLGTINILNNSGVGEILGSGTVTANAVGVFNSGGTISTLNNSARISGSNSGTSPTPGQSVAIGLANFIGSTLTTLNNNSAGVISGSTTGGTTAFGIYNNSSTITTLNNSSATISALSSGISATPNSTGFAYAIYNVSNGVISSINNSGSANISSINSGNSYAFGIGNADATIGTINNSGSATISGQATGAGYSMGIVNYGTIGAINNIGSASISGTSVNNWAYGLQNKTGATITSINNSATISATTIGAGNRAVAIDNRGAIGALTNSGRIVGANLTGASSGIENYGSIATLTNSGTISGGDSGIYMGSGSSIGTLINTGAISSGTGSAISGQPTGVITTLINSQGGNSASPATTALTIEDKLPLNYQMIINSPTSYGQLAGNGVVGSTAFSFYGSTNLLTSRLYTGVLQGLTTANVGAARSGTYDNMTWTLARESGSLTAWDLTFTGVSLMGTQQSLVNTANALAPVYAMQNSVLVSSFTYDCTLFDVNNICISVGGRNTQVSAANGLNNTSALLIAAYRPHPNYRIGAYADQNLSVNNTGSTVNLTNSTPLIGVFGAWTQNHEGTGAEVRVSAAYGQKDATINRQVVGLSEPGSGSSTLNSQGAQVTAKYGFGIMDKVIVSPYVGVRYTQNNMAGYTEGASSTVTAPLTYSALNTNATTALAGVGASYQVIPTVTTFASAGVETDTNTSNGTYSATGINGLTPVNFNPNPVRTRPTATVGAYYDIVKNQRFGVTGIYRQEAYQAVSSTTVMATYTIGL